MNRLRKFAAAVAIALTASAVLAACGDSSPAGPSGSASISAQLNGAPWSVGGVYARATRNQVGSIGITAVDPGVAYSLGITLSEVEGPGTYTLHDTFPLRFAVVTVGTAQGWGSTYGGGGGSVTITSLSETRITGSFNFTAGPAPSSSETEMLTVTNGQFDLPVVQL